MLRLHEDVQAEDALEERRVAEGHDAVLFAGELEADRDRQISLSSSAPSVPASRSTSLMRTGSTSTS